MPRGDPFVVPPGGFAGYSQMTAASRAALGQRLPRSGIPRKKRKKKSAAPKRRASAKRKSSGGRKPKFGSSAWHKKYKTGKFKK